MYHVQYHLFLDTCSAELFILDDKMSFSGNIFLMKTATIFFLNQNAVTQISIAFILIDGLHFVDDGSGAANPENTYTNGKTGIYVASAGGGQASKNSVIANHFSVIMDSQYITPPGAKPVIIHVNSGKGNYISDNHIVATTEASEELAMTTDSCFFTQVDALLTTEASEMLVVTTVLVERESLQNTILDSGSDEQVVMDKTVNAFRAAPTL